MREDLQLLDFLSCSTPTAWVEAALAHLPLLLIDHAHCEKKAALTALSLIHRYPEHYDLLQKMSRLAREECRHFEKVLAIMQSRGIAFCHLSASRYAKQLLSYVRKGEPERLIDSLIIGAFIEARSCERFAVLIPHLDEELANFYQSLLKSESRHFRDYLELAKAHAKTSIEDRIQFFAEHEADLINTPDTHFRFHSGVVKVQEEA